MASSPDCRPSDAAEITILAVGAERSPVIQIDHATTDPQALVVFAREAVSFAAVTDNLYPGLRAAMPLDYVRSMVERLDPLVRRTYALKDVPLAYAECFFSIVTTPAAKLVPLQTVPHIDTSNPFHFATVHYLCSSRFGGTAFFRQVSTGFETISPDREKLWDEARDRMLADHAAKFYPSAATPDHQQIGIVPAEFDRLILYRSNALHAGVIHPHIDHPSDPRSGRLTATMFIRYRSEPASTT